MKIPLSPMDYYFYRRQLYTIQFAFGYNGHIDIDAFQAAVQKTEKVIPALTARIEIQSQTEILLNITDEKIPIRIYDFKNQHEVDANFLFDSITNLPREPLVKIRITTIHGKMYLGFSFSHILGDAFSFFLFLKTLSNFTRGENPNNIVSNDRDKLFNLFRMQGSPVTNDHLFRKTGYIIPRPPNPKSTILETISLSKSELLSLKAEASKDDPGVTTNDALMAYLLQRFYRNIPLSPEGKLVVRCPVDYRKIYSRVPDNYFGNAVKDAVTFFDPNTFPDLSLSEVASEIRSAIASIEEASIYESLACLNDFRLEKGIDIFEDVGCPGLLVSNLSKLPFDAIDFGVSKPTEIFHASLNPRLAVILPDGEGIKIKFNVPAMATDKSHVPLSLSRHR